MGSGGIRTARSEVHRSAFWGERAESVDVTGSARRAWLSTTIIHLNGVVETYTRNVKRWRGGEMLQRWVCAALLEAAKKFRRVRGYRDMHHLVAALDALSQEITQHSKVA